MPKYQVQNMIDSVQDILEHNQNLLVSNVRDRASLALLYIHDNIERLI